MVITKTRKVDVGIDISGSTATALSSSLFVLSEDSADNDHDTYCSDGGDRPSSSITKNMNQNPSYTSTTPSSDASSLIIEQQQTTMRPHRIDEQRQQQYQTTPTITATATEVVRNNKLRFAVLVDSENAQRNSMGLVLRELRDRFGAHLSVKRVYGDFSREFAMRPWKEFCLAESFVPVHAFTYVAGKGSSDAALIIDAMELLYSSSTTTASVPTTTMTLPLDGFCIVSSDSDYTRLVQRLREYGKYVVGFGHVHTPQPYVTACDTFVYVNELMERDHDRRRQELVAKQHEQIRRQQEVMKQAIEEQQQFDESLLEKEETDDDDDDEEEKLDNVTSSKMKETKKAEWWDPWSLFRPGAFQREKNDDEAHHDESSSSSGSTSTLVNRDEQNEGGTSTTVAAASPTTAVSLTNRKRPRLPQELLDRFHDILQEECDSLGYCQLSILSQQIGINRSNIRSYGYNKLGNLLADYPEEFELRKGIGKRDKSSMYVRSLRGGPYPDSQLEAIHEAIWEVTRDDGWANMADVSPICNVDLSLFGYTKFSKLLRDFPLEFRVKYAGSTMLVKSLRK